MVRLHCAMTAALLLATLLIVSPGNARADVNFSGLGTLGGETSTVSDLSQDGTQVVGSSDNGSFTEAYLWSAGSMTGLGDLGGQDSQAFAISNDLTTVVGSSHNGERNEAFRWSTGTGMVGLGNISGKPSIATGVSADGSTIVGTSGVPSFQQMPPFGDVVAGDQIAFRWNNATGIESLGAIETPLAEIDRPFFPETILSYGSTGAGISADGETVFGNLVTYLSYFQIRFLVLENIPYAYTWTEADGFQYAIADASRSELTSANSDLSTLLGDRIYTLENSDPANRIYSLSDAPFQYLNDASEDGALLVGAMTSQDASQKTAAIHAGSASALKPYLYSVALEPTGWALTEVKAVSADGLTLAGEGINPAGLEEGWILTLNERPDPADLSALPDYLYEGLTSSVLPSVRTAVIGQTATVFASLTNDSEIAGIGCRISLADELPVAFDYHRTDPATNATIGSQNTPVDIPAGATQSFVIGFTPTGTFAATDLRLVYDCENGNPAQFRPTLNSVRLEGVDVAEPDIVALSATTTNDGVIRVVDRFSSAAFAVAAANVGAGGTVRVSADLGDLDLAVNLFVCETDPPTGLCKQPPANEVSVTLAESATATFGIFVNAAGTPVSFLPGSNRVFVRFIDDSDQIRGATSVALAIDENRNLPFVAISVLSATDQILYLSDTGETGTFFASISNGNAPETVTIEVANPFNVPVELSLCEVNFAAECIEPPVTSLEFNFPDVDTFASLAVFVNATAPIERSNSSYVFVRVTTPDGAQGERAMEVTTEAQP